MANKYFGFLPTTLYGWVGLILGLAGGILATTQFVFDWLSSFGADVADETLFSIMVLLMLCFACGFSTVANRSVNKKRWILKGSPFTAVMKMSMGIFVAVMILIMIMNGVGMTMDIAYYTYTKSNGGLFAGVRQLTSITAGDVSSLEQWALGIKQIVRGFFMIIPCIIGAWGGLSVLTADGISDAEGGILAIVAAFVVFIVVWIFKAIDVSLMTLLLTLVL